LLESQFEINDCLHLKAINGLGETNLLYESGAITTIPFNRRRDKSLRIDEETSPELVIVLHA
jgi:hypothetical protein